ncbi:MAG: Flp family type IVb pilin [Polaromonas sp.]|nr:Flp family type IVb pilin [Polaromonas sp.]
MKKFLNTVNNSIHSFAKDEEGAQVVEYALIVAVVSISLILALKKLSTGGFVTFIARITTCLTGSAACV